MENTFTIFYFRRKQHKCYGFENYESDKNNCYIIMYKFEINFINFSLIYQKCILNQ